ncbi:MAG: pilus assembly protein PilM [Candidatus Omnitrophica bacterium]|nr:pilus assembly protein PilM [Candidatus Omnitrophota bacterium]
MSILDSLLPLRNSFLAIEITESFIKMANIRVQSGLISVIAMKSSPVNDLTDSAIAEKISQFADSQKLKKAETINLVPTVYAISKNIEIPSIDKKEIKEIIDLQAGRHTPYSRNEIVMDYDEVGVFHGRYTKILLLIVKRDVVEKRYRIIRKAGFKAAKSVLSCEVITKLCLSKFSQASKDAPVGFIHVDEGSIDFSVGYGLTVLYFRPVPIKIADILADGGSGRFLEEIKKSLDSYQAEDIEAAPAKICFVGAIDPIKSVIDSVISQFSLPSEILTNDKILDSSSGNVSFAERDRGVSSLGLLGACSVYDDIKFSLIPEDVRIKKAIKAKAQELTRIAVLAMLNLLLFCAFLLMVVFSKKIYLDKMCSNYDKEIAEVTQLKKVLEKTGLLKRLLNRKGKILIVLNEFFIAIPKEVYLNQLSLNNENILTFTGTADNMSRVYSLVKDLEDNKSFKDVKVDFTKSRRVKDQEVADFGLTLGLEKEY